MSKYTDAQAKRKAQMVVDQCGGKIKAAVAGTGVDPSFLAGKIGVEAGVKGGKIVETATRFESGVYQDLKDLRDKGYCFVNGKKVTNYSGVKRSQIKDASDAALRALATSYGLSQIMGWHMINNLKGAIADLRDPSKHLRYTILLMMIVAGVFLRKKDYESCLRIWNTGKPKGKTYDPNYVHNALLVMKHAAPLLKAVKATQLSDIDDGTEDAAEVVQNADVQETDPADDFTDVDPNMVDENGDDVRQPAPEPDPAPAQQADNIINLGDQAAGDKPEPPKNQPSDVSMDAPPSEGFKEKIARWWKYLGFGVPTGAGVLAAVKSAQEDGTIKFGEVLEIILQTFIMVLPYVTYIIIALVIYRTIKTVLIQLSFNKRMEINGNPDLNNIKIRENKEAPAGEQPSGLFQRIFN